VRKEDNSLRQNFDVLDLAVFDKDVVYAGVSKDQLWRLEVASNDPDLRAEKREDKGEFEKVKPRQLGGFEMNETRTSGSRSCNW
jgi:hypothetical protein